MGTSTISATTVRDHDCDDHGPCGACVSPGGDLELFLGWAQPHRGRWSSSFDSPNRGQNGSFVSFANMIFTIFNPVLLLLAFLRSLTRPGMSACLYWPFLAPHRWTVYPCQPSLSCGLFIFYLLSVRIHHNPEHESFSVVRVVDTNFQSVTCLLAVFTVSFVT
jgi:hypothetical protein